MNFLGPLESLGIPWNPLESWGGTVMPRRDSPEKLRRHRPQHVVCHQKPVWPPEVLAL